MSASTIGRLASAFRRHAFAVALVLGVCAPAAASAQTVRTDFFVTNGQVNAQVVRDGLLYVGGAFTQVGAVTGAGLPIDSTTGLPDPGFPRVTGVVYAAESDGAGGWFIGGQFTSVDGVARANIAHVLADHSVDPWNPGTNGAVRAIALSGSQLFLGGDFTVLGSTSRTRAGCVDVTTGVVTSWNPNANGTVRAMHLSGSFMIVGGQFTTIGGQARNRIAELNLTTGAANALWNPNANSSVFALEVSGNTLYVGGQFTSIGGQARNRLAAVNLATGSTLAWNPNLNGNVNAIVSDSGTVYAAGAFNAVGPAMRNRIAAVDSTTGLATAWNPNASATVQALWLGGESIYAGGDFLSIGGQVRSRIAQLDRTTGLATDWNPTAFSTVNVIVAAMPEVFVGGAFTAVGGVARNNLAAIDIATGQATSWNPDVNNQVQALLAGPGSLYLGGNFTLVGGQIRNSVASVDWTTGAATAWDPNANGQVSALARLDSTIYVGGLFTSVGGQSRTNAAALDSTTGLAAAWLPEPDDQVFAIEPAANTIYLGGSFLNVGGEPRTFVGEVDASTGLATTWDPNADGTVRAISATCDRVYVGGFFTSIGGGARNRLAALDPVTAAALAWNPNSDGPVFALTSVPGAIYVGGVLTSVGGQPRSRAAAVNPSTGAVTSWNPAPNGTVRSIAVAPADVLLGGAFTGLGSVASGNLAAVSPDATISCPLITIGPAPTPQGVVGVSYSLVQTRTGGTAPFCWSVSSGTLPAGLTLDRSTGAISGTPSATGVTAVTITVRDVNGCTGTLARSFVIAGAPAVTAVVPQTTGLCLNPAQVCVTVPFALTRGESTPLRSVTVTFHVESAKLALCAPGPVGNSIHAGDWAAGFPNMSFSAVSNGGGSYTVHQAISSGACGPTTGGTLFSLDLQSLGYDGTASVTLDEVVALDCGGSPLAVNLGAAGSINGSTTPIVVLPASLPNTLTGAAYSETITSTPSAPGTTFAITAGTLPPGLTLSPAGLLSGAVTAAGTDTFTITATDAGGCIGSREYIVTADCPAIAVSPSTLPDGAVGSAYTYTLSATAGTAPFTFAVLTGTLPSGLTLTGAGVLSGTPDTAGQSLFSVGVTDATGCTASVDYVFDVFAVAPVSTIAAVPTPLSISSANPCVTVPVVYTRGEATPVRGVKVTLQLDPAMLALCTPAHPDSSITLGPWADAYPNTIMQVVALGGGAYQVDLVTIGLPCGITTGGTLFDVHVTSAGPDGDALIGVTAVKSRDCDNTPVPVMAGAQDTVRVHNTPLAIAPSTLPNALAGVSYSQALTASGGDAPYTFSVLSGALPAGLTLDGAGVLSGIATVTGSFSFTAGAVDDHGVTGSRAYTLSVTCSPITVTPSSLPFAQVGVPYSQTLSATSALTPVTWSITTGALPSGLTLSPTTGEIAGTPLSAGFASFTATATDPAGCTGSESYGLSVFLDPAASNVAARTNGLCLSSVHPTVSVPFPYTRGETAHARGVSVTFSIETSVLALVTPGSPASSIHPGSWLLPYVNRTFSVVDNGGGSYTVSYALTGSPCGPDTSGTLFTVDLEAAAGDGIGHLTVTSVNAWDCSGLPLPVVPGAIAALAVSHTAPPAIGNLDAAQVMNGNDGTGRTGITVTWSTAEAGRVALYRAPFGTWPEYDDAGGVTPDSSLAPSAPWTLVSANASSGIVDHPPVRGFWHYVAFFTDSCGNTSAVSNLSRGALDYHLGDVSNRVTAGAGDNRVALEDVSLLGAHYGISGATLVTDGVEYLDVGPTTDGQTTSRPLTDDLIDFEDLLMFALDFRAVSAPQDGARIAGVRSTNEVFAVEAPSLVEAGQAFDVSLTLDAGGNMQGFSAGIAWNPEVVEPVSTTSGGWIEAQGGVLFSPKAGRVDAALLGRRASGVEGSGEVARMRFKALREGDPGIRCADVLARDANNRTIESSRLAREVRELVPARTALLAPAPNPARGQSLLSFALARSGPVDLSLYGVDGRRVASLAHGIYAAGMHHIEWNGESGGRGAIAPGIYWLRLEASGEKFTRRLVMLR